MTSLAHRDASVWTVCVAAFSRQLVDHVYKAEERFGAEEETLGHFRHPAEAQKAREGLVFSCSMRHVFGAPSKSKAAVRRDRLQDRRLP